MRIAPVMVGDLPIPARSGPDAVRHPVASRLRRRLGTCARTRAVRYRHRVRRADGTWRSLVAHLTGGQGVAGSNPAVPTGSRVFSSMFTPHQSQQKSHLLVSWPFQRRAPIVCSGVLPGHLPRRQRRRSRQSRGQRSPSHLGSARRPRQPISATSANVTCYFGLGRPSADQFDEPEEHQQHDCED